MKQNNLNVHYSKMFFGDNGAGIARHDIARYPTLQKLDERMKSFFWQPMEIDMSQEKASFNRMTDAEKFVFTSNLRRQILLDSIQGRAPSVAFLPYSTDPQLEACIQSWSFFEQIHSISYGYIIRAIYPDPSVVFDELPNVPEIVDCSRSIASAYDALIETPSKENLYLALIAANALEALRFYVSFACTFSFGERGLVEGSAKTVKFIARDENCHLALVQYILKQLPQDDPDFIQIIGDLNGKANDIFDEAAEQERDWVKFLFQEGPILGVNEHILNSYVDYLLPRRKFAAGISKTRSTSAHPIPWVEKWFSNGSTQLSPQEVEISAYVTGTVKNDLSDMQFEF